MHNVFQSDLLDSRVKSSEVTKKEQFLGYLIGPAGYLAVMFLWHYLQIR
jgi:hypothetical protein